MHGIFRLWFELTENVGGFIILGDDG